MSLEDRKGLYRMPGEEYAVGCVLIARALYTGGDQLAQDTISPEEGPGCSARHLAMPQACKRPCQQRLLYHTPRATIHERCSSYLQGHDCFHYSICRCQDLPLMLCLGATGQLCPVGTALDDAEGEIVPTRGSAVL